MFGLGGFSHWVVIALVVLVLFGRGRISEMMGDFGKGIKSFKQGLAEEATPPPPAGQIPPPRTDGEGLLNGETVIDASNPSKPQ